MLALMGPKSRELLAALSPADFSDAAFPFGTSREIDLGYARVRASRLTYVGEHGLRALHAGRVRQPMSSTASPRRALPSACGMGGYFAINSLRMEKGYRHWGHDIGEEDTPLRRGSALRSRSTSPAASSAARRCCARREQARSHAASCRFSLPRRDAAPPCSTTTSRSCGTASIVGSVTSGAYGHRVGASLGMGYVSHDEGVDAMRGCPRAMEVEIAWKRYPCRAQLQPWYDPQGDAAQGLKVLPAPGVHVLGRNQSGREQQEEDMENLHPELERRIADSGGSRKPGSRLRRQRLGLADAAWRHRAGRFC